MDGPGLAGQTMAAVLMRHVATNAQTPSFDGTAWLQLFILIVALILAGLASASETALTSVSRVKLKNQIEEGDKRAADMERMLAQPNTYLTTILIVNNVAVIVASTMATLLALRFTTSFSELISTIVISLVVLIFCEITPKTAAVQNPMRWARGLFPLVKGAAWLLHPMVVCWGK
jgi:putative hemolysin